MSYNKNTNIHIHTEKIFPNIYILYRFDDLQQQIIYMLYVRFYKPTYRFIHTYEHYEGGDRVICEGGQQKRKFVECVYGKNIYGVCMYVWLYMWKKMCLFILYYKMNEKARNIQRRKFFISSFCFLVFVVVFIFLLLCVLKLACRKIYVHLYDVFLINEYSYM